MSDKTILIIEDEPTINRIITRYFQREGYTVLSALDGQVGLSLFHSNAVDLVCLDIMIPKINGWDVAKTIRETAETPIVLMSALSEEEDILKGFSLHVDDYITKPFHPSVLIAKINSLFERIDIERSHENVLGVYQVDGLDVEMSAYEESTALRALLAKDELTGIANRRFLDFHIANRIKETNDFHASFGILFIDIDYFKHVNDAYGHNFGDVVLRELAALIRTSIRSDDIVGRWGGEEFIAVIKVDQERHLRIIGEKIRLAVEQHLFQDEDVSLDVTISIGGTMYQPGESQKDLIQRADQGMYQSKQNGRNQTTIR